MSSGTLKFGASCAAMLSRLLESAIDAIVTTDADQKIVMYNPAAEKMFGWPADAMLGQPITRLIPARFHRIHADQVKCFGATGVTSRPMGGSAVVHGCRSSGEEFPADASISQLDTPEGKLFTVILRDATERVRSQEDGAALAAGASQILEQEKSRVARELHDELAQSLTALKMQASWMRDNFQEAPEQTSARLTEMLSLLDHTVAATRRIAADLRPLVLDDLGLAPAIEWLARNFTERTGVACELSVPDGLELSEPYATAVFRIMQESLVNVAKHAGATRVRVTVECVPGEAVLAIQDDGVGFDPSEPRKAHSLGLVGLRERAHLLKGTVQIRSEPGRGTRIETRIPLAAAVRA